MECFFDKCELINGIGLGLVSSFLASWFTYLFLKHRQVQIDRRKFVVLEGTYKGQTLLDPSKPIELNNPTSQASIKYISSNLLSIQLTDFPNSGHNKWVGKITMESDIVGTIVWNYEKHENVDLSSSKHLFGLKRLIKREMNEEIFIYLIDSYFIDNRENVLKEVLQKVK